MIEQLTVSYAAVTRPKRTKLVEAKDKVISASQPTRGSIMTVGDGKSRIREAGLLQTLAGLFVIPQAGLISWSVGHLAQGGNMVSAIWPAAGIVVLGLLRAGLEAVGGRIAFLSARLDLSRRRALATVALASGSPLDPARQASGAAASILGEQAELVVPYLARYNQARLKATIIPLAILVSIFPISWIAALILLIAMPLIPIFMALIGWQAEAVSKRQLLATGSLNAFLLDRLRGMTTIRALGAVEQTAMRLRADADDLKTRTMAVLRIAFLSSAVLELFSALGVALVAVYVGFSLLGEINVGAWGNGLDLTTGLFMLLLAPAFFEPLRELSSVWHDKASGQAAIAALDGISAVAMPIPSALDIPEYASNTIVLEQVSFRYGPDKPNVIDGLSLRIRQGERIALLGPSGSGKSTLLALIAGLAPASDGVVRVANDAGNLRGLMAWIGQKPHIFCGTLASNVRLGRTAGSVEDALVLARLGSVAAAYGKRPLGERGIGLSGGEALRLSIARAAYNPDIRIVLADEPTAHLDSRTATEITDSLLALAAGRTLIVATHDPRLAARMDRVIALDEQALVEAAQ